MYLKKISVKKILLFLFFSQLFFSQSWSITNAERNTLINIYNTTSGSTWSQNWDLEKDPKTWFGVKIKAGSVTELNLRGNALKGNFPPSISGLTKLEKLDLSSNQLSGEIAPSLASLIQLERLDISNNRLTGDPTAFILPLNKLTDISVGNNQFEFADINTVLQNFPNLQHLDISHIGLTTVPEKVSTLSLLQSLNLSNNNISQGFGNLSSLSKLAELNLSGNSLTKIPTEIAPLLALTTLDMSNNLLATNYASPLSSLTNLEWISFQGNQITAFPAELAQLAKLVHLNFSDNKISGGFGSLVQLHQLEQIFLDKNLINTFPEALLQLNALQMLSLTGNQLSGTIPQNIPVLTFLDNNRYTKAEIRSFLLRNRTAVDFTYSPQRYDEPKTVSVPLGAPANLTQSLSGNEYQFTWFKNLDQKTPISTESYYINSTEEPDFTQYTSEAYFYEKIQGRLMEVTFYREPITLERSLGTSETNIEFAVYPNPTEDYLNIRTNRNDIENVLIYDMSGKLIFSENSRRINVRNLPSATYVLSVKTSDGVKVFKFIKE